MNVTRQLARGINRENINILGSSFHEDYETKVCKTGYNFYGVKYPESKIWREEFRPIPENYKILDYIPPYLDMDLVWSNHRFGQWQVLQPLAKQFQIGFIQSEHTCTLPQWSSAMKKQLSSMRGDITTFISSWQANDWGFSLNDPSVRIIHHGVDTEIFQPSDKPRQNAILCVANDFPNRDYVLNYKDFCEVTKDLPTKIVGYSPGFSEAAKDVADLVNYYQTYRIYLNTAKLSVIPTSLLESMACGMSVVSIRAAGVSEYLTDGYDSILCDNVDQMRKAVELLMNDEDMAKELGQNATKTIQTRFNVDIFVDKWKKLIGELV